MHRSTLIVVPVCLLLTNSVSADALPINPGLWEFTTTSSNPLTGQESSETETECVAEDEFDPAEMMEDDDGCEILESSLDGDTLTFSMSCASEMGSMTLTGVYQSDGDSVQGTTNAEMSFGAQTMSTEESFTGKRVGDC